MTARQTEAGVETPRPSKHHLSSRSPRRGATPRSCKMLITSEASASDGGCILMSASKPLPKRCLRCWEDPRHRRRPFTLNHDRFSPQAVTNQGSDCIYDGESCRHEVTRMSTVAVLTAARCTTWATGGWRSRGKLLQDV